MTRHEHISLIMHAASQLDPNLPWHDLHARAAALRGHAMTFMIHLHAETLMDSTTGKLKKATSVPSIRRNLTPDDL